MGERLQKLLSRAGYGSRREIERWIEQGLIQVNHKAAMLGQSVTPQDHIVVKGERAHGLFYAHEQGLPRVLMYHKPVGEVSSRQDPHHPATVFQHLPPLKQGRWVQVGRLDLNTSGLLLFTNEGGLANALMHPRTQIEREYAVRIYGAVTQDMLTLLRRGVTLEDGVAKFKSIRYHGGEGMNGWYHVVLTEGRNREVRRLWQSQGVDVSRLIRVRYGTVTMPRTLARGRWLELSAQEVQALMRLVKL